AEFLRGPFEALVDLLLTGLRRDRADVEDLLAAAARFRGRAFFFAAFFFGGGFFGFRGFGAFRAAARGATATTACDHQHQQQQCRRQSHPTSHRVPFIGPRDNIGALISSNLRLWLWRSSEARGWGAALMPPPESGPRCAPRGP